jgi:hypothetical protein
MIKTTVSYNDPLFNQIFLRDKAIVAEMAHYALAYNLETELIVARQSAAGDDLPVVTSSQLKASTACFIDTVLDDLRVSLLRAVTSESVKLSLTGAHYENNQLIDIDFTLEVEQ